ncbi:unnamed protein product [Clonostachys rosea]|uniref:Fungal-type protein kinase domain-containing protein n=1 Tax=Bionectria ochroleuca TaxID=29856 RepID=A0ABY6U0X6_BIOOC|nr:unnamed protein product [Clonostachys rosea]
MPVQDIQKYERACREYRIIFNEELLEASGLNQMFTYRIDEEVHHSQDVTKMLGKSERPDRIFGLRQTRNIENLLYDEAKGGLQDPHSQVVKQVHELVELESPLALTGDRLLFPFLVLEAKSSNAADSWHSIQLQTAFSIQSFLAAQERLRKVANIPSSYQQGSVVWFMANKGEDWRLSICYPESAPVERGTIGTTIYHVATVWRGSICSRDGALQALLLVDYIFDWARDIYRHDIIRHLRVIATGNNDAATNTHADTDILSTCSPNYPANNGSPNEPAEDGLTREDHMVLDDSDGRIRHATFVELRYFCFVITKDNIHLFLQWMPNTKVQRICRMILKNLKKALQISAPDLDAMEEKWSGKKHVPRNPFNIQPRFHTAISLTTYISVEWNIVRDLVVIALAEDAWDGLVHASGLRLIRRENVAPLLSRSIDSTTLLSTLERLKAGSPRQLLLSAIERHEISLEVSACGQVRYVTNRDPSLWTLYYHIHCTLMTELQEVQEPFREPQELQEPLFTQQHRQNSYMIPLSDEEALVSAEGCILIYSTCDSYDPEDPEGQVCAYLTHGNGQLLEHRRLGDMVKQAFETQDVYHTLRNHRGSVRSPLSTSSVDEKWRWNLNNTYGVFSIGDFRFLNFIHRLGAETPVTQGSSRVEGSGSKLFT